MNLIKPFVVGEAKSSIFDSFNLLAALPAMQKQFATLRAEEAANPTEKNNKPDIFASEGRDKNADRHVEIGCTEANEKAVQKGVNKPGVRKDGTPTGLATQMSHLWIVESLASEHLTPKGRELKKFIEKPERAVFSNAISALDSSRNGRQLAKHKKSDGKSQEV